MNIRDSYIVLFEHENFEGATLTIPLSFAAIALIHENNLLKSRASSFYVAGPPNVWVGLHGGWPGDAEFELKFGSWRANTGRVNKPSLDGVGLNDAIQCVTWHVGANSPPGPHHRTAPSIEDTYSGYPAQDITGTADFPTVLLPDLPGVEIPDSEAWCATISKRIYPDKSSVYRKTIRARNFVEAVSVAEQWKEKEGYESSSVSEGRCN